MNFTNSSLQPGKENRPQSRYASGAEQDTESDSKADALELDNMGECALYRALQARLLRHGYHLGILCDEKLYVSNERLGLARTLPDLRTARSFLRLVEGGN